MGRYNKLLAAYDASASSQNALRQAMALADRENSWIKVLAVVPSYEGDLELVGVRNIEAARRGPVETLVRSAREIVGPDSANVITNVEQGEAYEKIIDVAEQEQCDLIVMGRRGLRHLERMLIGSVTARVIGHTGKDILVVPRDEEIGLSRMMVAIDGSAYSQAALERALYFAEEYDAELFAVSVVDILPEHYADAPDVVEGLEKKSAAILDQAKQKAAEANVDLEVKLLRGDPAEEITRFSRESGVGLAFVGSHGRAGIKKLLLGSVAEKVIGLSPCPVLVAKPASS